MKGVEIGKEMVDRIYKGIEEILEAENSILEETSK
jgi:hypothetical protein